MADRAARRVLPPEERDTGAVDEAREAGNQDASGDGMATASAATPAGTARFAPELAQLVVVLLWASTFVVTKAAFTEVTPLAFIFARFVIMVALAFAVLLIRQHGESRYVERSDWRLFILAGLTGYAFYQLGFMLGLDRTSPFSSSLLIAMVPLFTVLILALMREPTPLQGWIGLAVALVGVAIFLVDKRGQATGTLVGDLLSIGAAISFAAYGIVTRPLVKKYPVETYSAWSVLAGAVPLFVVSLSEAMRQDWTAVSSPVWLSIVYLAIFPVYIAYILWNWAIARRGVATASTFGLLVPIVAGALSAIFFEEAFGPAKLLGAALVLAGLVIVRLPRLPRFVTGKKGSSA
jgi:drug/metabolite transporter (DMT)-like permease